MSETLTTLEMLSQLKMGQMAKSLKVWIDAVEILEGKWVIEE